MQQIRETLGSTHILVLLTPNQTGAETNIICFWNARDQIYQSCYVMAEILEVDGYVKCSEFRPSNWPLFYLPRINLQQWVCWPDCQLILSHSKYYCSKPTPEKVPTLHLYECANRHPRCPANSPCPKA